MGLGREFEEALSPEIEGEGGDDERGLGVHPHHLLQEIYEQPRVLERMMGRRLRDDLGDVDLGLKRLRQENLRTVHRIHLVGCGSALHACLIARFWLESLARVPVEVDYASEYRHRRPRVGRHVLAIAVSQSGQTADTVAAVREADKRGARTLGVCNTVGSNLWRTVDESIAMDAGPERGIAPTKAFVAQLAVLYLFAIHLGRARGTVSRAEGQRRIGELRRLPGQLETILGAASVAAVRQTAERLVSAPSFLCLGRGPNYPVAREAALKLKQLAYRHAEALPAGEMKYGPLAHVEPDLPVVVVAPRDSSLEKVRHDMAELRVRGARLVIVGDPDDHHREMSDDTCFELPEVAPDLAPLAAIVPLQLLAYHIALLRGCAIDQPATSVARAAFQ